MGCKGEERLKFKIHASTRFLTDARKRVRDYFARVHLDEKVANTCILALDEAVTNVVIHGFTNDGVSEVEVEACVGCGHVELIVRDAAKLFDPTDYSTPDVAKHVKSGKKHGLGIFLMRKVMDDIQYRVVDEDLNELVMVKRLQRRGGKNV